MEFESGEWNKPLTQRQLVWGHRSWWWRNRTPLRSWHSVDWIVHCLRVLYQSCLSESEGVRWGFWVKLDFMMLNKWMNTVIIQHSINHSFKKPVTQLINKLSTQPSNPSTLTKLKIWYSWVFDLSKCERMFREHSCLSESSALIQIFCNIILWWRVNPVMHGLSATAKSTLHTTLINKH